MARLNDACIQLAYKRSAFSLPISHTAAQNAGETKRESAVASSSGFGERPSSLVANAC